jgi:hypothetical protein
VQFADLHDTPGRMQVRRRARVAVNASRCARVRVQAKGAVSGVLQWRWSRRFFARYVPMLAISA